MMVEKQNVQYWVPNPLVGGSWGLSACTLAGIHMGHHLVDAVARYIVDSAHLLAVLRAHTHGGPAEDLIIVGWLCRFVVHLVLSDDVVPACQHVPLFGDQGPSTRGNLSHVLCCPGRVRACGG